MVKTYRFLSAFILRILIGTVITGALFLFLSSCTRFFGVPLIVLAIYLVGLWAVLKLLQAHFTNKTLTITCTKATRKGLNIGLIISGVFCLILFISNLPYIIDKTDLSLLNYTRVTSEGIMMPDILAPFVTLPFILLILMANGYVRMFYKLAERMKEN